MRLYVDQYTLQPIGILRSPFREKFGIPRQPGLAPHAISQLELLPPFNTAACLQGIEAFSHLWLTFLFHATAAQGWQPAVRPPRLGGNTTRGVFATRSPFRPNPVGLSAVELLGVVDNPAQRGGKMLCLRGADLLDGTPVLDIKPYLRYADSIATANSGFADNSPHQLPVQWQTQALHDAEQLQVSTNLRALIDEILAQDPRPAYRQQQQEDPHEYGVWLETINVKFCVQHACVQVLALTRRD
ncbi:MAG: tRNA (N6-threonylcarbamoyladenosine(37)-N6)-methyltransferase TrmO [Pseudomonadales bacterium]|nr:tRNA (N6-threonylcarbamoyladenosine(37)-N6)-methyltransferase TrmO [Pseudomonadales bacterium]